MKKLILFSLLIAFMTPLAIFAQGNMTVQTVSNAEAQKNQAADDAFLKALQTGDVNVLDGVVAADFINHSMGEKVGVDSLKSSIQMFYSRFKPTKVEVKTRVINGEYFGDWVKYIGANPAMEIEGIEMTRYTNGKAVEHWFFPASPPRRRP